MVSRVREESQGLMELREAAVTWGRLDQREVPASKEKEDSRVSPVLQDLLERLAVLVTPGLLELLERPEPRA